MPDSLPSYSFAEAKTRKGYLKVYIGMIAGVGKTYRMLTDAHALLRQSVDVRIGEIVSHGRAETEALVAGLPEVAKREVFYKGRLLQELDVAAIIAQKPTVVLVDELAHTNVPGSRNAKRYQDVLEIVAAGISVYTAVNIQHFESQLERVQRVTGIQVTETIPDSFLQQADEVVNIDLPAQDLIQRLRDGKIYAPDRAKYALENFFQEDKILHLRDLALRKVAERVEHAISRTPGAAQLAPERFMACITTRHTSAKKILRKTARLASYYHADWIVLYIQTAREHPDRIDLGLQRHLLANLRWAAEQGARTLQEPGEDIAQTMVDVAVRERITTLVLGQPYTIWWRRIWSSSLPERLALAFGDHDIDIVLVAK